MKPSVILYKALPDDLQTTPGRALHRHAGERPVSPETVEQHAGAFASAEGLLGSSEKVDDRAAGENAEASCYLYRFRRL